MPCPYCKSIVEVNIDWAIRNGRVFCNSCCKAFDIRVGEEETLPTPSDPKVAKVIEDIEKELEEELDNDIANFDWEHF